MSYETVERKISLKDMLVHVIYGWKSILLITIVFAVLLGGLQAFRSVQSERKDAQKSAEQGSLTEGEQYENSRLLLESKIIEYESMIATQGTYLMESALMQLDPHRAYIAEMDLYVSTDYQIMPGMAYQNENPAAKILTYYSNILKDQQVLEEIAQELSMDAKYLKELITVSRTEDSFLHLEVLHEDSVSAEMVMDLLAEKLTAAEDQAVRIFGTHSMEPVRLSVSEYTGSDLAERQTGENARLTDLEKELETYKSNIKALEKPDSTVVVLIKWGILGAVAGFALIFVWLCVDYILSDSVHTAEELNGCLCTKILGRVVNKKRNTDPITVWVRKLSGNPTKDTEENYAVIAQRVHDCTGGAQTAALVGYADEALGAALAVELQKNGNGMKFAYCGNILEDADALRALHSYSNVLLVEVCDRSKYRLTAREIEQIQDAGSSLIGCIVAE